eukprot:5012619-Amphidinium_carterae.1
MYPNHPRAGQTSVDSDGWKEGLRSPETPHQSGKARVRPRRSNPTYTRLHRETHLAEGSS